jgi:hypothetical protein
MMAARHAMGQFVTSRENKSIAVDPETIGSRRRHTALLGRDFRHFRRHKKLRSVGVCGPQ